MQLSRIISKASHGDRSACKQLYDQYVDEMYSSAFRITNDRFLAEDVVQEAFVKSFSKLHSLKDKNNYQGWLRKIVINASLSQLHKKDTFSEIQDHHIQDPTDDQSWYLGISFDQIQKAIQELPDGCRAVFSLYALEGYKHREIAQINGIAEQTSKTQYRYAKKLLRELLTKKYAK